MLDLNNLNYEVKAAVKEVNNMKDLINEEWYSIEEICNLSGNVSKKTWERFLKDDCKKEYIYKKMVGYDKKVGFFTPVIWENITKEEYDKLKKQIDTGVDLQKVNKNKSNKEIIIENNQIYCLGYKETKYNHTNNSKKPKKLFTEWVLKTFQAWLMRNQTNQGSNDDTIKSIVKSAVKNELTKTLSKDEIKLELARNKTLQMQSQAQIEHEKAQKQIITEQERTKREQIRHDKEIEIAKRKETELELLRQKNINKKLKIKSFTEPLKQEIKTMTKELAQQAVQAEYTKKLKQLDADGKYMLYIFYNPTNPTIYKIGKSNSLGNRLAIGTSENPNLTILYKKWCNCQMACDELEETIHQELREYNYNNYSDTGSKEWFVLTKEKLNEIVNKYEFIQSSY